MAHFDTEYQRLEASYSDSPPGEENLLMHVPEGAKCMFDTHHKQIWNLSHTQIHTFLFCIGNDAHSNNTITDL